MSKIELFFGSILALFLVGAVAYAGLSGRFGGGGAGHPAPQKQAQAEMSLCGCFDRGFDLAASHDVLSSEYGTHFTLCRRTLGEPGGRYFTAGWNARKSAKPWQASCEAYQRSGA